MPISARITARLPRRLSSKRVVQILAAPVAVAALAGLTLGVGTSAASSTPSTSSQEHGMTSGLPFQDPSDVNTGTEQNLKITLTASNTLFNLSGRQVWGEAYNGSFVAPTLHLTPGKTATIVLVNHLSVATNLHFHGLHVSPTEHADDSFLCVDPGKTLTYQLNLPADHPQGTYWYHSHAMGTTCAEAGMSDTSMSDMDMPGMDDSTAAPTADSSASAFSAGDVENQIFAGLSGALIVGDDRTLLPANLRNVTAHTLVFKDAQIDKTGHIVQNTDSTSIDSNAPTVRLVNGELRPTMAMTTGQTQLWRLINAGADIFYQLQLDGYQFTVVGEDGHPVAKITTVGTLLLPPAKRYDVLVTAGPQHGDTWLRTLAYSNGPQGDAYPDVKLMKLEVHGKGTPAPMPTGTMPTADANLATATIAQHRTLTLSEDSTGTSFYIDGKQFSMDESVFSTPAKLGSVEEWTIYNTAGEIHPFHVHTDAFQVMSINGVPKTFTGRQDIVPIPNEVDGVPGKVVIRIPFTDFTGPVMFHCHIAAHEDNGMMSYINVVS